MKRYIKYLISLVSIGILSISYFYIFNEIQAKTEDLYLEAEAVKNQIIEHEKKLGEEDEVASLIPELQEKKQAIMNQYPVQIVVEDNFYFLDQLEKRFEIMISDVQMSKDTLVYATMLPAIEADRSEGASENLSASGDQISDQVYHSKVMTARVSAIDMNIKTDYQGLKALVEYINDYPDKTVISSMNISYDTAVEALVGSLSLKRYFLTGTGKQHKTAYHNGMKMGTDNIFGSRID